MKKFNKIIQIIWLAVAAVSAVEAYIEYSSEGLNQRFYLMLGVFVAAIAMYSIRKRQSRSIK